MFVVCVRAHMCVCVYISTVLLPWCNHKLKHHITLCAHCVGVRVALGPTLTYSQVEAPQHQQRERVEHLAKVRHVL